MSTNVEIINQLKSILAGASDLSFVQRIFIGARSNVVEVPAISIIPESEEDIINTLPVIRKALNCKIYGMNRIFEDDGVFINNTNDSKIGIFSFVDKVKKVLDNNNTLANKVINIEKGNCRFGYTGGNLIFFELDITIEYRTMNKVRS